MPANRKLGDAIREDVETEAERALHTRIFNLQHNKARVEKERDILLKEVRSLKEDLQDVHVELSSYQKDYSQKPGWLTPKNKRIHRGTLVAFLSDPHVGEVVNPDEIGGYNKYNLEIAEQRMERFFERTIVVARNYLAGVKYDGIVLPMGGDLVSGDIHLELQETNEISTLRTTEIVVPWLARGIEMFKDEFKKVHVVSAPGNHGRNTIKPRHKKRSENNADTHIARLLAMQLDGDPDITFDIPESSDVDFKIYDYTFTMEHGDNLRFNGTSEIGSIGPVKRGNLRKTKKRQEQDRPFKYGLYGHFHQFVPAYTQGFVMNGSIKGYDEYASDGQFPPEPAQQALMVVTPEHGITVTAPVLVSDRDEEGW